MGEKTAIEWTDSTWNPLRGTVGKWHCTKVSEGCKNCYAERVNRRFGGPDYKVGADTIRLAEEAILYQPARWKRPRAIFVCSMTDLFQETVPLEWIATIWSVMLSAPQHIYQVLTKRPERMRDFLQQYPELSSPRIWCGVSIEDQRVAQDRLIPLLETPTRIRWISAEPLIGPLMLPLRALQSISWMVVGGESGPGARPLDLAWVRSLRSQCEISGTAFFCKQLGSLWARDTLHNGKSVSALGDYKGGTMDYWPEEVRMREYPSVMEEDQTCAM